MGYYRIETVKVKKQLASSRKRKMNEDHMNFEKELLLVCKEINKQLKAQEQKGLDLSDKHLEATLGFKPTKSKKIRAKLFKEEIIFIPKKHGTDKKMRQTGPGTYAFILPNKDFCKWVEPNTENKKRETTPVEDRYNSEYCEKWHKVVKEYKELGAFDVNDISYAMISIHKEMNEWIAAKGKIRDDFRI